MTVKKRKHPMTPKRKALMEEGSKPSLSDNVAGMVVMLASNFEKAVSDSVDARFRKAVADGVDAEIREMHHRNYWLPPLWNDLSAAVERLARDDYGSTVNQKLLKRAHIERVEELCRAIGQSGTYFARKPVNH